jgi:uncharacterized protein (TIGR02466 family)
MNKQLHTWFPTTIMLVKDLITPQQNSELVDVILAAEATVKQGGDNWLGKMWNSNGTWDVSQSEVGATLVKQAELAVKEFVFSLGSDTPYCCTSSWANVGRAGSFQEFHTHAGSTISACYYAAMPEGSGKIHFQSPLEPDMLPIKGVKRLNSNNFKTVHYSPQPGSLLIWRSYLSHMVAPGSNTLPRVTVALNF